MGILTKIRQRPDSEKKIFSLVSAGILTVIIFVVWLSFTSTSSDTQVAPEDKLSSISPLQVIKDEFSKAFSNFKESTNQNVSSTTGSSTVPVEIVEATSSENVTASSTGSTNDNITY